MWIEQATLLNWPQRKPTTRLKKVKTRSLEKEGHVRVVRAFSLPPDGQNRLE